MDYLISAKSEAGTRPTNQDRIAYLERNDCLLIVVADGLGGYLRGDIAAEVFVNSVINEFKTLGQPGQTDPNLFLTTAILFAHAKVNQRAASLGITAKVPRTTGVVCLMHNNCAYWAHAGDSRLYHFRNQQLNVRTRDHTLTDIGKEKSHLKFEKESLNQRLLNSIGGARRPHISLSDKIELNQHDTVIACSDGIWRAYDPPELARYLDTPDLDTGVDQLMAKAKKRLGRRGDNMSAIAVRWLERPGDDKSWPATDPANINQQRLWQQMQKQWIHPQAPGKTPEVKQTITATGTNAEAIQTLRELEELIDEVDQAL